MTFPGMVRIVRAPIGEAPDWVRQAWIGLELPVKTGRGLRRWRSIGVLTGPRSILGQLWARLLGRTDRIEGYVVDAKAAVDLLAVHNPEAAAWWRENADQLFDGRRGLVFDVAACEPVAL